MDATLVNFAGAGFATVATGLNIDVPDGAITSGLDLVRHLAHTGAADVADLVAETAENIIGNWPRGQIPLSVIAEVLDAMPAIMDTHRPDANLIVSALLSTRGTIGKDGNNAELPGRRLAGDIVLKARADDTFTRLNVNESLAFFALERLFTDMLARRPFLEANREILTAYFASVRWQKQAPSQDDAPPAPATADQDADWNAAMDRANALAGKAELSGLDTAFEAAIEAYTQAIALQPRDASPTRWAKAEGARAHVAIARAERANDAPQAWSALTALNDVLTVQTKEAAPKDWAQTQIDIANGLRLLGDMESDIILLESAIATYQDALSIATRDDMPESWAAITSGLGQAKWTLGRQCQDRDALKEAYAHKAAVLNKFETLGMSKAANRIRSELRNLDAEMKGLPEAEQIARIA